MQWENINIKARAPTSLFEKKRFRWTHPSTDKKKRGETVERDGSRGCSESIVTGVFRHNFRRASIFMQIGSKHLVRPADWYSWRYAAPHFPLRFIVQNSARIFILIITHEGTQKEREARGMWDGWMHSRQWRHCDCSVLLGVGRWRTRFHCFLSTLSHRFSVLTWLY